MDFFTSIFASHDYDKELKEAKEKCQPASMRNEKHCVKCGFCCLTRTCTLTFQELEIIAEYLNLTCMQVFKNFLVVDTLDYENYYLRFINDKQKDLSGKFLSAKRTYDFGQCIMWDEEKKECRIYEVRPQDARGMKCWEIPTEKDDC